MEKRDTYVKIWEELADDKSMIFLVGPRQAGKTTLSQVISRSFTNNLYFNWDIAEQRANFIENPNFFEGVVRKDRSAPLIVFDEIHKYKDWKNFLKGVYDQFHDQYLFLVSGSGRLDLYQKGGDSLAGRYFLFHLWPFCVAELGESNRKIEEFLNDPLQISMANAQVNKEIWSGLSQMSGFPEPYLAARKTT